MISEGSIWLFDNEVEFLLVSRYVQPVFVSSLSMGVCVLMLFTSELTDVIRAINSAIARMAECCSFLLE